MIDNFARNGAKSILIHPIYESETRGRKLRRKTKNAQSLKLPRFLFDAADGRNQ